MAFPVSHQRRIACLVTCASVFAAALQAQLLDSPDWSRDWSPLRLLADLPAGDLRSSLQAPALLTRPSPAAGLFWTTGNPAALPDEQVERWSSYRLDGGETDGQYRRPLDPGTDSRIRLSVEGWGNVTARSAAAGRVVLERAHLGGPAAANQIAPYGSNPLVVLDTSATDLGSTTARIEGAVGMGLGPFGLGVALGFDAGDTRTVAAPVPRTIRSVVPAAVVGATWRPPGSDRLRIGVQGRWQQPTDRINLFSLAAPTRVYQLTGYGEPAPIDVVATFYRRDIEGHTLGLGTGVAAGIAGVQVVLHGELARAEERHSSVEVNDPPTDTWTADVVRLGASAERGLFDDRLRVLAAVTRVVLNGETRLYRVADRVAFTAREGSLDLVLDARAELDPWQVGLRASGRHQSRLRVDSLVGATSDVRSWTSVASLEVARALGPRFLVAVGGAYGGYRAAGSIPNPSQLGTVYRMYAGPELALDATDATALMGTLTLRWQRVGGGPGFFVQGSTLALSPSGHVRIPLAPGDVNRRTWTVRVGFTSTRPPG
jgi:hypothetical protein